MPNPEHDLGTDLWLLARDARRFDLKALLGAQVKTGESYFAEPESDMDGALMGWWFREENDNHFEYWCEHAVPHILVLHDLQTRSSYWVPVTRDRVISTGKGRKILVPAASKIDADHSHRLAEVATASARTPQWEGSVWEVGEQVPESARLRFALLTPRIIAPHPNRVPDTLDPCQAIAVLIQLRLVDLEGRRPGKNAVDIDAARHAPEWEWRLFAALYDWILEGKIDGLRACVDSAPAVDSRVAAVVCAATALLERGEVAEAMEYLTSELEVDVADPVDYGWLQAHAAQCHLESGNLPGARELALEVQVLRRTAPSDASALAITAAAAYTLFCAGDWDGRSLSELIQGSDTAATWWRSQTLATGLAKHFDESFKQWAGDSSRTFYAQDVAWTKLRSAMLLAGFSADRSAWRHAASLLGCRQLMNASDEASPVWALDLLRLAGSERELKLAVGKLLEVGPITPLIAVGKELQLDQSTRTSLHADLSFVQVSADVLKTEDCDRHVHWALRTLRDPDALRKRLNPQFLIAHAVLGMLRELVQPASREARRLIMDHLLVLPGVEDQLMAQGYGSVLSRVPDQEWAQADVAALLARNVQDNFELRDAIEGLLASKNPGFRATLLGRVAAGDLRALGSYGNVTDLPREVAASLIANLEVGVDEQVADARRGAYGLGGSDHLRALVLLNLWHPGVADWTAVESALGLPASHPSHLQGAIRLLGQLADRVPDEIRVCLQPHLQAIAERHAQVEEDLFHEGMDIRGDAALTLALLFPAQFSDSSLRQLACGVPSQRAAAVEILIARRDDRQLSLLAVLAHDPDISVKAASAEGLAYWVTQGVAMPGSKEVLDKLLAEAGTRLAVRISRALTDETLGAEPTKLLVQMLQKHPSAVVRARARLAEGRIAASSD